MLIPCEVIDDSVALTTGFERLELLVFPKNPFSDLSAFFQLLGFLFILYESLRRKLS